MNVFPRPTDRMFRLYPQNKLSAPNPRFVPTITAAISGPAEYTFEHHSVILGQGQGVSPKKRYSYVFLLIHRNI